MKIKGRCSWRNLCHLHEYSAYLSCMSILQIWPDISNAYYAKKKYLDKDYWSMIGYTQMENLEYIHGT
jgi:hypothetical protein